MATRFRHPALVVSGALSFLLLAVSWTEARDPLPLPGPHPDAVRERVEIITASPATYIIHLGGTLDAEITRSERSYGHPWVERFQPNRYISISNLGREAIETPWISADGRGDWIHGEDLALDAVAGVSTPRDKALSAWSFMRRNFYRVDQAWGQHYLAPVVAMNTYGYGECASAAMQLGHIAELAGVDATIFGSEHHWVTELWWDGAPHLLDPDRALFHLPGLDADPVSTATFIRDHDIGRHTHALGSAMPDHAALDSAFTQRWDAQLERRDLLTPAPRDMRFVLRPGETLYRGWQNWGKFSSCHCGPASYRIPPGRFGNGYFDYVPDLRDSIFVGGMESMTGLRWFSQDGTLPALGPAASGEDGTLILKMDSPYVIVGGAVSVGWTRSSTADVLEVYASRDGSNWTRLWSSDRTGSGTHQVELDAWIEPHDLDWLFSLWIKVRMVSASGAPPRSVGLDSLAVRAEFQLAPSSLPSLILGPNTLTYRDEHSGGRLVRIAHGWEESSANRPPQAPRIVSPRDGAAGIPSRPTFDWSPAADPDGNPIDEYHVQVSERADFAWPASPNFDRHVSSTPYVGRTDWRPPFEGQLYNGETYYWRVRARDSRGAWGPWTLPVRFSVTGPAPPESLAAMTHGHEVTLEWRHAAGAPVPQAYLVYGADEQGFSPSASSFMMEVTGTSCLVRSATPRFPNQNRTFYRLISRDTAGWRSAPSECIELPHPAVKSMPPVTAVTGARYTYPLRAFFAKKFDRLPHDDESQWIADLLPPWLTLSPAGVIEGSAPSEAGIWPVSLRVLDGHGGEGRQEFAVRTAPAGEFIERIPLNRGCNLVSWPIVTATTEPAAVLETVLSHLDRIVGYDGREIYYQPGDTLGLTSLDWKHGYWIVLDAPDTLEIHGGLVEPSTPIVLDAGWNLVPFLPFAPDEVSHAFGSLGANLVSAAGVGIGGNVEILDSSIPEASTLRTLKPGGGYWVNLATADTLRYPTDTEIPSGALEGETGGGMVQQPGTIRSPFWAALYGDDIRILDSVVPAGELVQIFDRDGTLCGTTRIGASGGAFPFTPLWGDDPLTPADEGATPGDTLIALIGGHTLLPAPVYQAFGGRIRASGQLWSSTSISVMPGSEATPSKHGSLRVSNPIIAGSSVRFDLSLPAAGEVVLRIYTPEGRMVSTVSAGPVRAGSTAIEWDARDAHGNALAPGVYFAKLTHFAGRMTRKLVIVR